MSRRAFDRDLERFEATFTRLDALVTYEDGWTGIDPGRVPPHLLSVYNRLLEYGYANGLIP